MSSPNGILLFREASKVICSYGEFISIILFIINLKNGCSYLCYYKTVTENALKKWLTCHVVFIIMFNIMYN